MCAITSKIPKSHITLQWFSERVIQCKAVDGSPELRLPASVADIMNRWVLQMGYPLVTIDTTTGTISQKHFLLDPNAVVQRPSIYK